MNKTPKISIRLQKKQQVAAYSKATEILYGGAAGGGKSFLMRAMAIIWCCEIKGLQVFLFRRTSKDLFKNHMTGSGGFYDMLGEYTKAGLCKFNGSDNCWIFWNGSRIWLCHCQHEKNKIDYQGAEIHVMLIDELTHFTHTIYKYLRARCRLGDIALPDKYKGQFPRIICGSNPGGVGHSWVKSTFVSYAPEFEIKRAEPEDGGMLRQYIPAKLSDNKVLQETDPNYENNLKGLGNPELVRAMLNGDWDIVAGGALSDLWNKNIHCIKPFKINSNWNCDRSFDWGSSHPFSVLFWAESNGEEVLLNDGSKRSWPRGTLFLFNEIYGGKKGTNEGFRWGSRKISTEIIDLEKKIKESKQFEGAISPGPADNQISNVTDRTTDSIEKIMSDNGVRWTKSDKSPGSRSNGLQLIRDRLQASIDGEGPGLYVFQNCVNWLENVPVVPLDQNNPEDVDTKAIDHDYDATRYKCLDKPFKSADWGCFSMT